MKLQKPIAFILFMLGFYGLHASSPTNVKQFINHKEWNFVENKGQIPLPPLKKGESASNNIIRYYGHQGGVYLYCQPGKISFVFTKVENTPNAVSEATGMINGIPLPNGPGGFGRDKSLTSKTTTSRADLVLLNSNPSASILASDQQEYYENYYTSGNADSGITNVHTYKTITYRSIYPNIDLVLHACPTRSSGPAKLNGMKYEFVVYPGGNVNVIQIQWDGLESIEKLKNSKIEYACSLGKMIESKPVSFQGDNIVKSDFNKSDNRIGFNVGKYDKTKTLVIDPTLEWGTYFGGSNYDEGDGIATDDSGYVYITGTTQSDSNIATSGAYQTLFTLTDAYVAKFSRSGSLVWATYFGGENGTLGTSVATDDSANLYLTGYTNSTKNIATKGVYQTAYGGNTDAFLAKFKSNGIRQWATYYGGSKNETAQTVAADNLGGVYIGGETSSNSGIATSGAFQSSLYSTAGLYAGFLAKFSTNGLIQWATYYGGSIFDDVNGVAIDPKGNAYIVGFTGSTYGIASSGAYQTFNADSGDAFLAKFNPLGVRQWGTYFGGNRKDWGNGVANDNSGNVFICGSTLSLSKIATNGAYQTSFSGGPYGGDGFLAKFNGNGSILWATYYGGPNDDEARGVSIDKYDNAYITGVTQSKAGIATNGAYQSYLAGPTFTTNGFLIKFNSNGSPQWGTYYGGSSTYDEAYGVACDNFGSVYITGRAISDSGISTKGAYQHTRGGDQDAFLAKFGENFPAYDAGISSIFNSKKYFCADTQSVNVQLHNYGTTNLDSATIYLTSNGKPITNYHWKGNLHPDSSVSVSIGRFLFSVGKDTLKSWTSNPNGVSDSVPENDTSTSIVTVLSLPSVPISPNKSICTNSTDTIGTTSVVSDLYSWTSNPAGFHSSLPRVVVSPLTKTTYYLTVTSTITGCSNSDSVTISLIPLPNAFAGFDQKICDGDTAVIGSNGGNGGNTTYSWTSDPPGFDSITPIAEIMITPILTRTYILIVTSNVTGCTNKDSVKITVNPLPVPELGPSQDICFGNNISIGKTAVNGYRYLWTSVPKGFTSTDANPSVSPVVNTLYKLKETTIANGCRNSDSVSIIVNPLPVPKIDSTYFTICTGSHIRIGGNAETGMAYAWTSMPPGFTSTLSGPIVKPVGDITYFLTETNIKTGCSSSDSAKVIVTVPKAPVSSPGFNQTICFGANAVIGGDPFQGLTYSWLSDPSGFVSSSPKSVVKPDTTTTYYLTVKNNIGCTDVGAVKVNVNPLPVVKAGVAQTVCSGTTIQLGASSNAGDIYSWTSLPSGFNSKISDPIDSPNVTTKYYLKATIAATGCTDSDSVKITVIPRPDVQFDVKNMNGFEYQFAVKNPNYPNWKYQWVFGDSVSGNTDTASGFTVTHSYTQNGKYNVIVTVSIPGFCTEKERYQVIINENFSLDIFPNPFETQADIKYTLTNPGHVRISVVDEIGRQLGVLVDKQLNRGEYNTYFDAAFWKTRQAMYFVLFQLDDKLIVKKIIQLDSIYH